jgi:hypothetical protein
VAMLTAPNATTFATRVPYVTPAEFRNHPTGVDTKNLVPGASADVNAQSLVQILRRASSYADNLTEKVLAATLDTWAEPCRVMRDGSVLAKLDFSPVIGVATVQAGLTSRSLVDIDPSTCELDGRVLTIPTSFYPGGQWGVPELRVKVTYINGWANAQLTVNPAAGATTLQLNNGLGITPGMTLQVCGSTTSESVIVDPSFIPVTDLSAVTLPLTAPLVGNGAGGGYSMGDVVTNMPQSVKLATIMIAVSLIKTRGDNALVMSSVHEEPGAEQKSPNGDAEMGVAMDLLAPFRRTI